MAASGGPSAGSRGGGDDSRSPAATAALPERQRDDGHARWHRERRRQEAIDALEYHAGGYAPIALEDHELDGADGGCAGEAGLGHGHGRHGEDFSTTEGDALWAREVSIDGHVVVRGGTIGGSYVVWRCTVETLDGGPIKLMKRYSEFESLRRRLATTFPNSDAAMPALPQKSMFCRSCRVPPLRV